MVKSNFGCRKNFSFCVLYKIVGIVSLVIFHITANASATEQVLRGRCINSTTQLPVSDASIAVYGASTFKATTDSNGNYFLNVVAGRYSIVVERTGFKSQAKENVVVNAGKEQVYDFELTEFKLDLTTVTVKTEKEQDVPLNNWNIQQFASVFYDPGRVVNSHSGAVNNDDQGNNMTIRGTSPNYIQWKIEGLEVVNPNHLENAGTINDRPTLNGGGVSLISAQLLQNSGLQFAPFDPTNGNALSGIFDIRLRKGNDRKMERTIQASLLGTDICLEGPFSSKSQASYLVNFRYSTVGLLSKLGINFGDEKINFKDLSFVVAYPFNRSMLKLYGITGNSENIFRGKTDSSKIEFEKDLLNIDYHSFTSVTGLSFITSLSNTLFVKTAVAYSAKVISRNSIPNSSLWTQESSTHEDYQQQKLSGMSFISKRLSNKSRVKAGTYINYFVNRINNSVNDVQLINGTLYEPLIQPFISFESDLFKKFELKAGLHAFYQTRINYFSFQPRLTLRYLLTDNQDITFNYGVSSQLQPFTLYLSNKDNWNLKPTQSNSFSLTHQVKFRTNTIKTEIYYQLYTNVAINKQYNFSMFNYFNEQIYFPLNDYGIGRVYGVDLTYEKHLSSFYLITSLSVYKSEFSMGQNNFMDSRFNTKYNAAITAGKEYKLKGGNKFINTDFRILSRNGYKEPAVYHENDQYLYTSQLPSYYRLDIKLSYKKYKEQSTIMWALDIQNLTGTKNITYHYYDRYTQKVEAKYQLGLVPVLSYKILF
jgi:hypothetical protein